MVRHPVLVLFAHPMLQTSRVNRCLIDGIEDIPGVTFFDLYQEYPDLDIDVREQQELLEAHDFVVFHHPFYWYSTPAMLKEWQDLVLQHGWAYGREGTKLHGKTLMTAVSTGAQESAYCREGENRHTVRQLMAPIEQTALLCGMRYLAPFVVHAALTMTPELMKTHRSDYHRLLGALAEGRVDLDAAAAGDRARLNRGQDLDSLILPTPTSASA